MLALATDTANSLVTDLALKLRNVQGMPVLLVKDILDRARGLQDQLLGAGEVTSDLRHEQGVALIETGRTWRVLGDTDAAMADLTQARVLFEELAKTDPSIPNESDRALAIDLIGDIQSVQGDLAGALKNHQEFARHSPGDERRQSRQYADPARALRLHRGGRDHFAVAGRSQRRDASLPRRS